MFTRFQASSGRYLFDAPLCRIPAGTTGDKFLGALGGAYEREESSSRASLLDEARRLKATLEGPPWNQKANVRKLVSALEGIILFLNSISDDSVSLYSYEGRPTIDGLLDTYAEGAGANDWALEQLAEQGDKARKSLLNVLKKETHSDRVQSAVAILLTLFYDAEVVTAVKQLIDRSDDDLANAASSLLAAYTAARQKGL